MNKTVFRVTQMDCPAEEQLIRMKLSGHPTIETLEFDLPNRQLTVFHADAAAGIARALDELRLGSSLLSTEAAGAAPAPEAPRQERQLLLTVLLINAVLFGLEAATGWWAHSMGLVADSLDMLADALVYGLALYAVGRVAAQKPVARVSGYFQLALALAGLVEVGRRFLTPEPEPMVGLMVGMSVVALLGNAACLYLLQRSHNQQAHMQASQIFTSNDIIANLGVIVAAGLVHFTGSALPDLVIGLLVFLLVGRGALQILQLAK